MAKPQGKERAAVMQRIKAAQAKGLSATRFISDMKAVGLSYRRTTMLADWRSVGNVVKKTGLLKYVRKGFVPSPALYAEVSWNLSQEFLYKIKVQTRLYPGKGLDEHFVNIVSDKPMTPGEWESEVAGLWDVIYMREKGVIVKMEAVLAVRRQA